MVSHVSAAVLHGLDHWAIPLDRVHLTRDRHSGGHSGRLLHLHTAPLNAMEIVEVGGVAVTTVARTIVDLARSVPFEHGVVVADAALHSRFTDPDGLVTALERARRWPGNRKARRVVAFADGRSESPGESRSRVAMHRAGLPAPTLQWDVYDRHGRWLARVDFGWPELGTVGEFDGEVKYGPLLRPGQDPGQVVFEEKIREDAVRDQELRVARWIWRELASFDAVAARLRGAFGAA